MKKSPVYVGLLQSLGLIIYVTLVGLILLNGQRLFGSMTNLLGPILFLSLFVVSTIICALITLAYPFLVFWDKKNTKGALKIVGFTAAWLTLFVLSFILFLVLS